MAIVRDLYIDQGADYVVVLNIVDDENNIIDLTGFTVKSQMRKTPSSKVAYNINVEIYDAIKGTILLGLTSQQSENIPYGGYLYDVEIRF